jgi:hypothetical protein
MQTAILGDRPDMDLKQAQNDVVRAALQLIDRHPEVRNIVLECANMPPYRNPVEQATARKVHDLETLLLARAKDGLR